MPSNTLDGWRSYAERLEAENLKLETEVRSLRREILSLGREVQELRPYKVRFDETREKRRAAGKRGGRGRVREN